MLDGGPGANYGGLPPHNIAAERAVLGAALQWKEALNALMACGLDADDFFREEHRWIWVACLRSMEETGYADAITVSAELGKAGLLDRFGPKGGLPGENGATYVAELTGDVYTHIGVEAHAKIVIDTARQRRIIQAAGQIAQMAYAGQAPAGVIQHALSSLGGLLVEADTGMVRLGDLVEEDATGPEWGIPLLDRLTMGMVGGRLTILAGPSKTGKSMLAALIARHVAEGGGRVAIFTAEMSNGEYQDRIAHSIAGVKVRYNKKAPPLTEVERELLQSAREAVGRMGIYSRSRPSSVEMITANVRLMALTEPVSLVVIDYLQIMDMTMQDAQTLKDITRQLKQLAMEVGCHVLLLSQMNRAALGEMRGKDSGKLECIVTGEKYPKPFLEGLMGGAIENDADLVVQLQHHSNCEMNHIEVVVTKNRHGIEGHGMMIEDFAICRLTTMTEREITEVARGDMTIWRGLMRDQGWMQEE